MKKLIVVTSLLRWMEKHLKKGSDFSVEEVAAYFADSFIIKTNGRFIEATPSTYRGYLYKLKSTLKGVKYDVEEEFEGDKGVAIAFIIHLDFNDKKPQALRAISLFKIDKENRITDWNEVFTDAFQQTFSYDPDK